MKKLILLGISCVMLQTLSHTQTMEIVKETQTNSVKNFSIFFEGDSGTFMNDSVGRFTGNSTEIGVMYTQNFTKARWFNLFVKTALEGTINFNHRNLNTGADQIINPEYELNGVSGAGFGGSYLEIGTVFSEYFALSMRHNLLIKAFVYLPFYTPNKNMRVRLTAGIEARPYLIGIKKLSDTVEGAASDPSIENLMVGISYDVTFAQGWNFLTDIQYRTHGGGTTDRSAGTVWVIDSMAALKYNSKIRWDNILSYKIDNISIWGAIRYETQFFVNNPDTMSRLSRVQHHVYLRSGLTYTFDFTEL